MKDAGWEIASHGLKWIEHKDISEAEERAQMAEAIRLHTDVTGEPPARLVHGPHLDEHRAAGRRRGRLSTMSPTPTPTICPTGCASAAATS
jgi:peptidoglycan/xylan/chitin deacetylase (PgdA/CDA1 family)